MKELKQCRLVTEQNLPDGTIKRSCVGAEKRVNLWLRILNAQLPVLAEVGAVYLSIHSTSCASERNLSVFGRLYDTVRRRLQLRRGENMNDNMHTHVSSSSEEEAWLMLAWCEPMLKHFITLLCVPCTGRLLQEHTWPCATIRSCHLTRKAGVYTLLRSSHHSRKLYVHQVVRPPDLRLMHEPS
jgi:hypothetical protein